MLNTVLYFGFIIVIIYICFDINKKGNKNNKIIDEYTPKEKIKEINDYNKKKAVIQYLFTKTEVENVTLDTDELKNVMRSNDLKRIDGYLQDLNATLAEHKNFVNINEFLEIIIDYVFKSSNEDMIIELLEVIILAQVYFDKNVVSLERFEKNISKVSTPILRKYIEILRYSFDEKYLETLLKFEKHEDFEVRENVKAAVEYFERKRKYNKRRLRFWLPM